MNPETVYIVEDSKVGYVGIHRNKTSAEHHAYQRKRYFKNNEMIIKKALIKFI